MMKNLFLDCGSNVGQGFTEFRQKYNPKDYDFFLFEPNPFCFEKLKEKYENLDYVTLHNVGVGANNEKKIFFFKKNYDVGGSVIEGHASGWKKVFKQKREVKIIDLLELVNQVRDRYNKIVVKLDVESSEYDILEKFIKVNSLDLFEKIYVEFHSQYMDEYYKPIFEKREQAIISYFKNNNVDYVLWR